MKTLLVISRTKINESNWSTCARVYATKPKTFQTFLRSLVTFYFSAPPHKGIKNRAAYIIVNM